MTIDDVLELVANYEVCRDVVRDLGVLPGLPEHYRSIQAPKDRELIETYERFRTQAQRDLANLQNNDDT